jgi:WD40-like Beta Propeller Repeat
MKNIKNLSFLILLFGCIIACTNSEKNNNSENIIVKTETDVEESKSSTVVFDCDYLGENPPENEPKLFAPGIISTGDLHSSVYFSPDGKEIYYSRLSSGGDNSGVLCKKNNNNKWSDAIMIQGTEEALTPFISLDGKRLFCSLGYQLYIFNKTMSGWSEPINLGKQINFQKRQDGIYESSCRTIYFTTMFGKNDGIYYSEFINESYQSPVKINLGLPDHPTNGYSYISPDESYLIFQSRVEGGYGASDLYIMFKDKEGKWMKANNMGNTINTKDCESFPYVSPDGKYFFFNSNRISEVNSKVPSHFYGNVYWLKTDIIHRLEENAFNY